MIGRFGPRLRRAFGAGALLVALVTVPAVSAGAMRLPLDGAGGTVGEATSSVPAPKIVQRHIPYSDRRKQQMAGYARSHYGEATWRLRPRAIVLHFTESDSVTGVIAHFARNAPARGESPGVCAHYLVAKDGTIYELVPPSVMCRHTIGLNHRAVGIEVMQSTQGHSSAWADRQILARKAQVRSLLLLTADLQHRYGIANAEVYGHGNANSAKGFRELKGWRNDHTDWGAPAVVEFRRRLAALR